MSTQLDRKIEQLDKAMKRLRVTMTALPNRVGGFKKEHDDAARRIATMTTIVEAARPLFNTDNRSPKARRH
ncbi:hypothetical protein ABZU76_47250 [Amycolatopsis sp. NPDC005232]|uniref:hypothetical protein n=1 Tax=Amycolatopsis sp. NPDC005232 TaxID=3157027 RepID=UPI0033A22F0B